MRFFSLFKKNYIKIDCCGKFQIFEKPEIDVKFLSQKVCDKKILAIALCKSFNYSNLDRRKAS